MVSAKFTIKKTPRGFCVFKNGRGVKLFSTKPAADKFAGDSRELAKMEEKSNALRDRLKKAKTVKSNQVKKMPVKNRSAGVSKSSAKRKVNGHTAPKRKVGKKNPNTASSQAKAAISIFDNDFDLDLDANDVRSLRRSEKPKAKSRRPGAKPRTVKGRRNPVHPLMALSAGASGILSALQIKKMMAEEALQVRRQRTSRKLRSASATKRNPERRRAFIFTLFDKDGKVRDVYLRDFETLDSIKRFTSAAAAKKFASSKKIQVIDLNPKVKSERRKQKPKAKSQKPKTRNPKQIPHRRTFETFQGRPATTGRQLAVSRLAPDRLDQLGDLIEIRLADGRVLKPNPKRFKLCAGGGRLWIAGGTFARPDGSVGPRVINPIDEIDHVVYGTFKPHHGDNEYTHYIHHLGEESGHRPILAVDSQGYPVIRGGRYKIEARGIVN